MSADGAANGAGRSLGTVIVTGGSSGLGAAVAAAVRDGGGKPVVLDLRPPADGIAYREVDLSRPHDAEAAVRAVAEEHGGRLADAFVGTKARFCLVSFDSDWLYPTQESRTIAHALNAAGAPVSFVELSAPFGHDSFLLNVPELDRVIAGFLN